MNLRAAERPPAALHTPLGGEMGRDPRKREPLAAQRRRPHRSRLLALVGLQVHTIGPDAPPSRNASDALPTGLLYREGCAGPRADL